MMLHREWQYSQRVFGCVSPLQDFSLLEVVCCVFLVVVQQRVGRGGCIA